MLHKFWMTPLLRGTRRMDIIAVLCTLACALPVQAWSAEAVCPTQAKPLHLSMTAPYDSSHPVVTDVFQPWIKAIRDQSHGAIQIDLFDASTLLIESDAFIPLVTGSLSLGGILPSNISPPLPVSDLFNAYLDAPNTRIASRMVWESVQFHQALKAEMQLVHLLWGWASSPLYLHSASRAVRSTQDMQGMKLLVWSNLMEKFVASVGGIPVLCLPAESSTLLRKGLAEGIICPIPPLPSFGIAPYIHFTTDFPMAYYSFFMGMNKEIWNALPPQHKQLFTETTGRIMANRCGAMLDKIEGKVRYQLENGGHAFVPASKEFQQAYQDTVSPIRLQRLEKVKALNIPGMTEFGPLLREIYSDIRRNDAGHSF